ncbi:MAG TPA: oligopeptide transporter, OPT family [Terriglobales bacterium]|nr:oligopeptide transporter, OPT family [Terriglobales bacterium]
MSTVVNHTAPPKKFTPFVPPTMQMKEFTFRAVILGMIMTGILGAANAYLGLRAGMTIAATYPAAVIGMAILRIFKGSILEENIARTIGSIGESVAAGAVFTIPAFVIAGLWHDANGNAVLGTDKYWQSVALMAIGGTVGILFVTLLRRVMVEDPELPFPESVAASEIHKAGQQGAKAAKILFANMGFGAFMYFLSQINLFWYTYQLNINIPAMKSGLRVGRGATAPVVATGGMTTFTSPAVSPAYLGVGYIIGPRLAALNFAGGVVAWGLLVPLLVYFMGPGIQASLPAGQTMNWAGLAANVWFSIVRPIAVGGMLVGAGFTLFRMRKQLGAGMARAVSDLKKSTEAHQATDRTERDLSAKVVFLGVAVGLIAMIALYYFFINGAGNLTSSKIWAGAIVAGVVMIVLGFFFAAVSGNLVGMIGSSNNPVSGLTLCTLVVAALLMVALGVSGVGGVAAVLGVAAVVCVSSAVAGEMLQDLKVGHILGGTPAKMQIGDIFGIAVSSLVLFFPLMILDKAYHFGSAALPAPQAGLMALLAQGIVGGNMAWPLVVVGIFMGFALIMVQVKSPMLFAVGMYLPLETTFAIFVGGIVRWITDGIRDRRGYNDAQKARVDNAGVLTASGLVAGEALCGLVIASIVGTGHSLWHIGVGDAWITGLIGLAVLIVIMIKLPLANAGSPDEPAPPTAIM